MRTADLVNKSVNNLGRSKTRTGLTVAAIFIGSFTLTITTGIGTGISNYIDDSVAGLGSENRLTVVKTSEVEDGPQVFEENQIESNAAPQGPPGAAPSRVEPLLGEDISFLQQTEGVVEVSPSVSVEIDYVQSNGEPYQAAAGQFFEGTELSLVSGNQLTDRDAREIAIPSSILDALDLAEPSGAIGESLIIGFRNSVGELDQIQANVVAVTEGGFGPNTGNIVLNSHLQMEIYDRQNLETVETNGYPSATITIADEYLNDEQMVELRTTLTDAGYQTTSLEDQLGTFTTIIDVVVMILNAFALIVLFAAAFGIVNTLYMSVQDRTKEIGLMKAIGSSSRSVFGMFAIEAALIGLIGSLLGVVAGVGLGVSISDGLSEAAFADLVGLNLIQFDPFSLMSIIILVMLIGLIAGLFPAREAALKDPIAALRYE